MNGWLAVGALAVAILFGRKRKDEPASTESDHAEDETDALARVITSEADSYSEAERLAIAWTVRNRARRRGVSILQLVCSPACGRQGKGRPFSSARRATDDESRSSHACLPLPQSEDPTRWSNRLLRAPRARPARVEGLPRLPPHRRRRPREVEPRRRAATSHRRQIRALDLNPNPTGETYGQDATATAPRHRMEQAPRHHVRRRIRRQRRCV